jgi:RHS repeat-associated protein
VKGDASYTYNGFRSRVAKLENFHAGQVAQDPCKEIKYVLDMTRPYDNLLATQGTENQSFVWGNNLLSAHGSKAQDSFHYLQDHLGSPIRLFDSGSTHDIMSYDEFGVPEVTAETSQPFSFTGYQHDSISGLHYAQARQYAPTFGRFTSEDQIKGIVGIPQSFNQYAYCWNQPIDFVDLDGLILRRAIDRVRVVSNTIIDGVSNAADVVGQWASENSTALITAGVVLVGAAVIVATAGAATPLVATVAAAGVTKVAAVSYTAKAIGIGFGIGAVMDFGSQLNDASNYSGFERLRHVDPIQVIVAGATVGISSGMVAVGVPAPVAYGVIAGAGRKAMTQARNVDAGRIDSIDLIQIANTGALTYGLTAAGGALFNGIYRSKCGGYIARFFGNLTGKLGRFAPWLANKIRERITSSTLLRAAQSGARAARSHLDSFFNITEECEG